MKSTEQFKQIIQAKLEEMAATDPLFSESFKKENKNIDDCITYILNTVKATGCTGFAPDEVFGMAAHYYDEDDIKVGAKVNCRIVTNQSEKLSNEEKAKAKEEARKQAFSDEVSRQKEKLKKKAAKVEKKPETITQQSLF